MNTYEILAIIISALAFCLSLIAIIYTKKTYDKNTPHLKLTFFTDESKCPYFTKLDNQYFAIIPISLTNNSNQPFDVTNFKLRINTEIFHPLPQNEVENFRFSTQLGYLNNVIVKQKFSLTANQNEITTMIFDISTLTPVESDILQFVLSVNYPLKTLHACSQLSFSNNLMARKRRGYVKVLL